MAWFRHRSWFRLGVLACTAVFTVWCLGCKAFEPLLACADQTETSQLSLLPSHSGSAGVLRAAPADEDAPAGDCSCGCPSCHATVAVVAVAVPDSLVVVVPAIGQSAVPAGIVPPPVVPPPQSLLQI